MVIDVHAVGIGSNFKREAKARVNAATLAVAIIGAVTGLAALTAQVWQTAVSGPRVMVSASNTVATETRLWWLSIDLTNVGRLPVTVADVGVMVEVPGKEWQKMPYAGMPTAWRPGLSFRTGSSTVSR